MRPSCGSRVYTLEGRLAVAERRINLFTEQAALQAATASGSNSAAIVRSLTERLPGRRRGEHLEAAGPDPVVVALFDTPFYLEQAAEAATMPLEHYLEQGEKAGLRPNPYFDPSFYRNANPDVAAADIGLLEHFALFGGAQGRAPSAAFDTAWYVATYGDVAESGLNPLLHFLTIGQRNGYRPLPDPDRAAPADHVSWSSPVPPEPASAAHPDAPATTPDARRPLAGTYVGNNRVLVYLQGGGRLFVSADDLTLLPELLADGIYDVPFTRFLQRTLNPASIFVDVGANVGLFSIVAGHVAWSGRTIAYEPAPQLVSLLRDNVAANWFNDRVTVRPVAVAATAGRATFGFPATMHMLGGIDLVSTSFNELYPDVPIIEVPVDVVSLDDEFADGEILDVVKIDVEGGEAAVLKGMQRLIEQHRVRHVSIEVRRDPFERNKSGHGWSQLVEQLHHLADAGGQFAAPGPTGELTSVGLDEVVDIALFSNLVVSFPG